MPISKPGASAAAITFAGFVALAVAMGIGRFAFTPLLPMMQQDAGVSVAAGGWLASANYLGYFLGALSVVWLRIRAAPAIRAGLLMIGMATLAMGLTHRFAVWWLLRAVAGIMSAWVLVFVSAWCLEKLAPLRRPILSGMVFAGVGAGIAAAGALSIALMYMGTGSAHAWIAFGVLALVLTAVIWPLFDAAAAAAPQKTEPPAEGGLRWDRECLRLILCYGAFGFSYIIPATFLPVMARQAVHEPLIFGLSWPIFGLAALVSTLAAAVLQGSIGNRRLWIVSHLVMAFGVALPVFRPDIIGILLAALFVGGTFMVITMTALREAREVAGRHATGLIAAMTAAFAAGQIAGPIGVSCLIDNDEDFSVMLSIACLLLTISAYALSGRVDLKRLADTEPTRSTGTINSGDTR